MHITTDEQILDKASLSPVFITAAGAFLPNEPVGNDRIEAVLGMAAGRPSRLKTRILAANGIQSRHYALDAEGRTTHLNEELATNAITEALQQRGLSPSAVDMLAVGTTLGDVPVPGFASMVHGRLGGAPMEILSAGGVCCSGMAALRAAYLALRCGEHRVAVACGSELVSRMLKGSRFTFEHGASAPRGCGDFDAEFLRWMLSDGAGAVVLEHEPAAKGLSLRLDWIELTSHANEHAVCMFAGMAERNAVRPGATWLDYPTIADAERAGVTKLRQDTRLLPVIVRLGVEEYVRLLRRGRLRAEEIDHVLCHYSSKLFKGEIMKQLAAANVVIPEEKWFSNLTTKGNTGAASIYIMLEECVRTGRFQPGDQIVLMVPESGRFSVSFAKLTCVGSDGDARERGTPARRSAGRAETPRREQRWAGSAVAALGPLERTRPVVEQALARSPLDGSLVRPSWPRSQGVEGSDDLQRFLAVELALVWADFERMLRATPIGRRLEDGTVTVDDYRRLLCNLRQQVIDGARWIARAASNISIEHFPLRSMFLTHAADEHRDYQLIERDFIALGGRAEEIATTPKNIGAEALSAFIFEHASQADPFDLLGAMFVIEGLGAGKARQWAERLTARLRLREDQVSFLRYHSDHDERHFGKLEEVLRSGVIDQAMALRIIRTAKVTARLYALQLEEIDNV